MSRHAALRVVAGKPIGHTGYGLMGLTRPWDFVGYPAATKLMKTALNNGANFWNGGIFYGTPEANSLHLLHHYFTAHPADADSVVLSIKGAFDRNTRSATGSPEAIRASVAEALRVLDGVKKIDIFQCARVDPEVPIETSIQALAELVADGSIGGIGLSEVSAKTIRRAHAVHPIASVEIELSLFSTDVLTNGVAEACRELNIPLIAYSPLSRGFLATTLQSPADLPPTDMRHMLPRFQPVNFDTNRRLVTAIESLAKRKGATVPQIALAWVRAQGAIPIPGATTEERLLENMKDVELSEEELLKIAGFLKELPVLGGRYPAGHEKLLEG